MYKGVYSNADRVIGDFFAIMYVVYVRFPQGNILEVTSTVLFVMIYCLQVLTSFLPSATCVHKIEVKGVLNPNFQPFSFELKKKLDF